VVEGEGRAGLVASDHALDCGNSGSTMRLLAGVLVARRFTTILTGDESVRARPMERLAGPLRSMGATVSTVDGHAPIEISGGRLRAVEVRLPVPTAQVKSAVLLAGLEADGTTTVLEPAPTRDHTERALACLGVRVTTGPLRVSVEPSEHGPLEGHVPGDVSSAAFLVAAAAVTGGEVEVHGVGLNPTRTHFLRVLERMGVDVEEHVEADSCGEPVGTHRARGPGRLLATTVDAWEIPLVIDEVPVLAAVASHASTDSWFVGAGELRVKESDRLRGIAASLRDLGGIAAVEGDDLVVAGGGLRGGATSSRGDHRMAMAMTVAALGADGPTRVDGIEAADVSFPGFVSVLRALGAAVTP
jgi:3-phosphoshikimate 1-carboxyvinyltransferase